jgi:Abnormal spindle-like microcephaly-assoc'd, ASPM-SPD-2-Hydin
MNFRFCPQATPLVQIVQIEQVIIMRSFPGCLVALAMLSGLASASQQLQCNPCTHGFGQVQVGTSATFSIRLTNTSQKTLSIRSKSMQGSAFSFGNFSVPKTIAPGASVELPIIFRPKVKGYTSGSVAIGSNAVDATLSMHVGGDGIVTSSAELRIVPSTLNFGNVTVGSNVTLRTTLTASNRSVTISSDPSKSSEFAVVGLNLPATIPAGQSIQVSVKFTPNASGTASSKVGFFSNATDSPAVENVTGTGVAKSAHYVSLSWDPGDAKAVGYNIFRGTAKSGPFQAINTALHASTTYIDNTVVSGHIYYYATTEVNAQGHQSGYSNVVRAVIPSP